MKKIQVNLNHISLIQIAHLIAYSKVSDISRSFYINALKISGKELLKCFKRTIIS